MRSLVRIVSILVAAGVMAGFPPAAAAKGTLEICGASACATLAEGEQAVPFFGAWDGTVVAPSAPAPYYELRQADTPGLIGYWVPSAHALRLTPGGGGVSGPNGGGVWTATTAAQTAMLVQATQALAPHAAPAKVYATVNGVTVRHPRGWLSLYTIGTPASGAPGGTAWLSIYLGGARPSPWTDGADTFLVSRRGPYLERDGRFLRIPAALAKKVRARKPLA